jgi:hypothetical protein
MRITKHATICCTQDHEPLPSWVINTIIADFTSFARSTLPTPWEPIPESESLSIEEIPGGYAIHWSIEINS